MQKKQKTENFQQHPQRKLSRLRSLTTHDLPAAAFSANYKGSFQKLERSLSRDNNKEQQQVAEPEAIIPGFQQQVSEGKLWNYFSSKMDEVASKVEKEKVNCRQKHFWVIKQQIFNLRENYAKQIAQIQSIIKNKYMSVHTLFEQIRQERALKNFTSPLKGKKNKKQALILDNTQKLIVLKQQVQLIRNEVNKLQLQLTKINQDCDKLNRQWINFLKSILKGGYYLKQGMITIFKQMIIMDYYPKIDDLPDILDQISKKCLIQEYNSIKNNHKLEIKIQPQKLQRSRILSEAKQSLSQIARRDLVREVYKDTKQFMANLVKQPQWKTSTIILPKIQVSRKQQIKSWRDNQKKRLMYAYTGDNLALAKGILFGWKMQSIQ